MKNDFGTVPLSHVYRSGTVGHCIKEQENCMNSNEATCLKSLAKRVLSLANPKSTIEDYNKNTVPLVNKSGTDGTHGTHGTHGTDLTDLSYEFEERAAIIEFDGGFSREEAEYLTRIEMKLMSK
jgi:hypothetical protein